MVQDGAQLLPIYPQEDLSLGKPLPNIEVVTMQSDTAMRLVVRGNSARENLRASSSGVYLGLWPRPAPAVVWGTKAFLQQPLMCRDLPAIQPP